MKNIFTPAVKNVLFESVFIALLVFGLQNYLQKLWAPDIAGATLKKQNYISAKKDVYFEAINIVTKELSGYDFHMPKEPKNYVRNIGATLPSEFEINSCLNRLYIYSNNEEIISSFKNIFRKGYNPIEQNINLIKNIRQDLGSNNSLLLDNYEYVSISRDTTVK